MRKQSSRYFKKKIQSSIEFETIKKNLLVREGLNSSEPIKVAHLQILANQSVLKGALVIEKWLNNSFSESKKNFCRLIKLRTPKVCISTRFC